MPRFVTVHRAPGLSREEFQAARKGRGRSRPLRVDWDQVKDAVMRRAVWHKFQAHPELQEILLGTGDALIIEDAPGDASWGCGPDGNRQNQLFVEWLLGAEAQALIGEFGTAEHGVALFLRRDQIPADQG